MRLLICAGGTGGGVYPALSIHKALANENLSVLWVGGEGGMEAGLVTRAGIPFKAIPAAGIHGVGLRALPGNALKLARGTLAARRIVAEFKPHVMLFTGGYIAAPVAIAGRGVQKLLYVPDIEPGLALKFVARFASVIGVTVPESARHFSPRARLVVTGYPTRPELGQWTKSEGRARLGMSMNRPVLLVTGGSKGAHTINEPLFAILPRLLKIMQVIHLTGSDDSEKARQVRASLPADLAGSYFTFDYLHDEMGAALAAADLVLSRAGASTLGEYPLFGLPAILVPYQYAWRYQLVNARYLESHRAAIVLEAGLLAERLLPVIEELVADSGRLEQMSQAMRSLARPNAARQLAALLHRLAGESALPEELPSW